ncbi:uncharacterized protein LOC124280576 [Haliotis rubra]|uniref:uncharacterized protein LOC124280576 n=1 Tax=Haliotis rubra TaxID=36100 RepID=UPI001EE504E8|nr:uncharacterized protein LOC124280576 [Haliotis rubra]XP_046572507.1 uncharacterized protein LOC124280576 [Haliotis rubra]XP_046572508.1 uncharacterized protein LOC124280576 [Haliotis rubra]
MALPEDVDDADRNQEAVTGNGTAGGARDGRHPISTTDAFAGELPEGSNAHTLSCQAVLGLIGQRVTSVTGSEDLDVFSKNSVAQQLGSLSISTQGAITQNVEKDNENEHANEVASTVRARECFASSTENPDEALTAPSLSLDSLKSSLPPASVQRDTIVVRKGMEDDSKVKGACATTERGFQCDMSYFGETKQHQQHQHHQDLTSGYVSECTQTQTNGRLTNSHCRSRESRVNTISCRSKESKPKKSRERCTSNSEFLQLSAEGVKELLLMSGTQRKAVHKDYHSFVWRLQSFKDFSCVYGVKKDILALAGFFYSGFGTVTCYHCGCSPRIWTEGSDPKHLHWQWAPKCRFIRPFAKRFS